MSLNCSNVFGSLEDCRTYDSIVKKSNEFPNRNPSDDFYLNKYKCKALVNDNAPGDIKFNYHNGLPVDVKWLTFDGVKFDEKDYQIAIMLREKLINKFCTVSYAFMFDNEDDVCIHFIIADSVPSALNMKYKGDTLYVNYYLQEKPTIDILKKALQECLEDLDFVKIKEY